MTELEIFEKIATVSFPTLLVILGYLFLSKSLWPWFTGPHQEEKRRRWQAKHDSDSLRDRQLERVVAEYMDTLKMYQNGYSAQSALEHQELNARIDDTREELSEKVNGLQAEFLKSIARLGNIIADLFTANNRRIEEWRRDIANVIKTQTMEQTK